MILDLQTVFSGATTAAGVTTGQAITATALSTNVLDMRNAAVPVLSEENLGEHIWLVVQSMTAAAGGDAAKTITITLESDSDPGMATTPVVHFASAAIVGAAVLAGATLVRTLLPSADYQRYLAVRYTVSAGFTAFAMRAFLTPDVQRNKIMPTGFTIDV